MKERLIAGLPVREYYRQWRQRNPEATKATQDKYRQKPENRERARGYSKAHGKTQAHKDAAAHWYLKNAEQEKARVAEWRKNNQGRHRGDKNLRQARRRARLFDATVEIFTQAELRQYWIDNGIDPDICIYCSGPHEHDDHVIPLARNGAHERANLVPACAQCNNSKGVKLLEEWQPERFAA